MRRNSGLLNWFILGLLTANYRLNYKGSLFKKEGKKQLYVELINNKLYYLNGRTIIKFSPATIWPQIENEMGKGLKNHRNYLHNPANVENCVFVLLFITRKSLVYENYILN